MRPKSEVGVFILENNTIFVKLNLREMKETVYLSRLCDKENKRLQSSGAVLIEGAKWCGKTWTAAKIAKSTLYMQNPDTAVSNLKLADTKPSLLLQGNTPID